MRKKLSRSGTSSKALIINKSFLDLLGINEYVDIKVIGNRLIIKAADIKKSTKE